MERVPLFPLGTVLVPGARLPLRIFEPRYLRLVQDLLGGARAPEFGVVAIRVGAEVGPVAARDLYPVGCVAVLERVDRLDERSYHIRVRGSQRFRIEALAQAPEPYLVAEITRLTDRDDVDAPTVALARHVRARLSQYRALLGMASDADVATGLRGPGHERALSYRIGDLVVLPLAERQRLLEAPTTRARLDLARRLLAREVGLIGAVGALPHTVDVGTVNPN